MASLDDINDVTAAFLVAAVDALNLTDAGAPGRAYTNASRPAMDCCGEVVCWAQVLGNAESLSNVGGLQGSTRPQKSGALPVVTVFIQATRCAPTPTNDGGKVKLPTPEALAAVSRQTSQDLWALWNHINYELKHGMLAKVCSGAWRDGATAVDNQGGCVGWELVYRYPIEGGYPFTIDT